MKKIPFGTLRTIYLLKVYLHKIIICNIFNVTSTYLIKLRMYMFGYCNKTIRNTLHSFINYVLQYKEELLCGY